MRSVGIGSKALSEDAVEMVSSRDVQVGEVGRIGLVQGVVDLAQRDRRGVDCRLEQGRGGVSSLLRGARVGERLPSD